MRIEFAMQREDQRDVFSDCEVVGRHLHALSFDLGDLVDEVVRVDDDAVADDAQLARAHDARGQQR